MSCCCFLSGRLVTEVDNVTLTKLGEPQLISDVFPLFPRGHGVDAALTYQGLWLERYSYLFYGDKYWR